MEMIREKTELLAHLESIGYDKPNYRIAVEALIFTPEGKILLERRGREARDAVGKLEGVGGKVSESDNDLLQKLQEEIRNELGATRGGLKVAIERLLEVRQVQFSDRAVGPLDWVVVSYLCRIIEGTPVIGEPRKIASLEYLTLDELYAMPEKDLSNSMIGARETYKAKYGNRLYYEVPEDVE